MTTALPLLMALSAASAPLAALNTTAERSSFARTGRYEEAMKLCMGFEKAFPNRTRCEVFGTTPEGRPMIALVASTDGALDAASTRKRGRPVLMWQAGIHPGEIDGKDAGFMLIRDVLAGRVAKGTLSAVTVVFVPVVNVDGHERFGPNQRPNQNGPQETGWRVNAQNLNLNRDYAKVDAPETAAMLRLLKEWDPVVNVDLHVTDGAQFQHDVSVMVEPRLSGPDCLKSVGANLQTALVDALKSRRHQPVGFYPEFMQQDEPTSGFAAHVSPPRLSNGYWPLRNRLAVLVETHSWKDYKTRVRATYDALLSLLELANKDGAAWIKAAAAADDADHRVGGTTVDLTFEPTDETVPLEFLGYAYRQEPSEVSGAQRIRYDPRTPQVWNVPFHPNVKPVLQTQAPEGGYVVPAAHAAWMEEKLTAHGFTFEKYKEGKKNVTVEAFRVKERTFRATPYEGRFTVTVKGTWQKETTHVAAGSLYVPIAQRGARLLVHLMDPAGPDSFVSWGFFHAMFEQKEYMESYVAEDYAEKRLKEDTALRAAFKQRVEEDAGFAADPAARLLFFHQHHPSWDAQWHRYPVVRVKSAP